MTSVSCFPFRPDQRSFMSTSCFKILCHNLRASGHVGGILAFDVDIPVLVSAAAVAAFAAVVMYV